MVYPKFNIPMYKPLRDLSTDNLFSNINKVPQNTIALLEANQSFIESYMIGLNHEMSKELLWREFPTDQRGSYFRQFWDVSNVVNFDDDLEETELEESLKDIKEIHTWKKDSPLGSHNNRDTSPESNQVILLIRGDLLKKYPNVVIYAQKAMPGDDEDGPRRLKEKLTNEDEEVTSEDLKFPLYSAKIEPDVFFLGFDLEVNEVKGKKASDDTGDDDTKDSDGWFFVIEERLGEPRFGLDIDSADSDEDDSDKNTNPWNNMSWKDFADGDNNPISESEIPVSGSKLNRKFQNINNSNSNSIKWGINASNMAYILHQAPVRIAIHASDLLENL